MTYSCNEVQLRWRYLHMSSHFRQTYSRKFMLMHRMQNNNFTPLSLITERSYKHSKHTDTGVRGHEGSKGLWVNSVLREIGITENNDKALLSWSLGYSSDGCLCGFNRVITVQQNWECACIACMSR